MRSIQPFGDVPDKLTEQLRRSFVATRTFAQALMQGKQVINRILKVRETERERERERERESRVATHMPCLAYMEMEGGRD